MSSTMSSSRTLATAVVLALFLSVASAFTGLASTTSGIRHVERGVALYAAAGVGKGYDPKWKKKQTLGESTADLAPQDKGLVGTISVVFHQGNTTKTTLAMAGQPVSFVAAQAGQFIRYGCKKGECGTCEALCNGKWIRPCTAVVPDMPKGQDYVVTVKAIKSKSTSSGKFYSARSFVMGFYNNLLGMVGFVKRRRAANRNFQERMDIENAIKQKALEKKQARARENGSTIEYE